MNSEFHFSLNINRQEYLRYYAGEVASVQVRSVQGALIQFPASALKPWVTHTGIAGYFSITLGNDNKLIEITKLN